MLGYLFPRNSVFRFPKQINAPRQLPPVGENGRMRREWPSLASREFGGFREKTAFENAVFALAQNFLHG